MTLYIILAAIGFVLIIGLWFTQRIWLDNILEATRKKRMQMMKDKNEEELKYIREGRDSYENTQIKPLNYVFFGCFIVCLLVAWVLFFVYSAGGRVAT